MKLKAKESTAVKLFVSYRRKGIAQDNAIAIVSASLGLTPRDLVELLTALALIDTALNAADTPATDMAQVDIAEGLNALSNEAPRQPGDGQITGDGQINFRDILEDFTEPEGNA